MKGHKQLYQSGSVIVSILVLTLILSIFIYSLIVLSSVNLTRARNRVLILQAQYSAESGADAAIAILNSGNSSYIGTAGAEVITLTTSLYKSTYVVSVVPGADDKEKIITAAGRVYAPAGGSAPTFVRNIEVVAQRSALPNTFSLLSRNILETGSSVKDVKAKDIYVNGYINLTKNVNNLIAENITVADKNTGASNCSIDGTGTLTKPTSFSTPGQTKTIIRTAYNNCLSPPGNNSNGDFDVLANQTDIDKIQSTLIPYSEYMDSSYQNSIDGCSDWTSGSFPRNIPKTPSSKATHYPDQDSGISSSCGSSGDLSLATGQYNINDHVHIRANLCASSGCRPTFYNPDSGAAGIKFVFIEGSINFDSVTTVSGSGPIVFVVYGADPASKTSVCPYGGAAYIGNNGNTIAPDLYLLATNGVCLDKTRFGDTPSLGGLSGKNLYINTNSGTPHDLKLDVDFPVGSVPIDLAWRATRYRHL